MRRATSGGPVDTAQKLGNCGTQVITGQQACGRNAYCEWGRLKNRYWATQRVLVVAAHRTHRGQAIRTPCHIMDRPYEHHITSWAGCTNTISDCGQNYEHHVTSWTDNANTLRTSFHTVDRIYEHRVTPWTACTNTISHRGQTIRTSYHIVDSLYATNTISDYGQNIRSSCHIVDRSCEDHTNIMPHRGQAIRTSFTSWTGWTNTMSHRELNIRAVNIFHIL